MRTAPRLLSLLLALLAFPLHAAISGSVMSSDGQAIAAAKISLFFPESIAARRERLTSKTPAREPLATATSDANGNFRIEPPKDKPIVELRVEAAGFAPDSLRVQSDDDAGALVLLRAEPKNGAVKANGKGVAGATVVWGGGAEYTTTTDANGRYTAPDPTKWANRLVIIHPDYARLEETLLLSNRRDLDRTLNAGVKVTGKVVGDDGKSGVANAVISIDGWPAGKSGADGVFTFDHAPKDWQQVYAVSGSRIAARANGGPLTLKLAKGATITGTVRDVKSQLPVLGVDVQVSSGTMMGRNTFVIQSVQTDAKGIYTFTPLPAGTYTLFINRPNYTIPNASVSVIAGQTQSKAFFATALARVTGMVTDEDKRPVAAARVMAQSAGRNDPGMTMIGRPQMSSRAAFSGPDGRFVARVAELDTDVQINAGKKGYPAAKSPIMRLASGERKSGVNLVIPRGVAFSGRVTDMNGKPLSGVSVDAAEAQGDFGGQFRRVMIAGATQRGEDNVTTASDGTFTIRLKEGKYDVIFKREGFAAKNLRAQTVAASAPPVAVTMEAGVEISGRVVRSGVGVEGVNVNAMSQDGMANSVTGPDGSFTLPDLTPGQMMLSINKMDAMIQEIRPVTAPARDLMIEVPAGGRITGRVVDKATHQPITSFQAGVTTSRGGGGMVVMMPPMLRPFTSDDGTFTLENVKPGPTQVVAMAAGYTTGRAPNVEVEDGKTASDVEVALETGAKLTGKVTDTNGAPVAGVSVRADMMNAGGARIMRFDAVDSSTTTDPNGDYTIDSVEPGEKTFIFQRSGFVTENRTVTLASGKDTRLDVSLSSGMRIGGTVVTEGGVPVADATVNASSAAGGGRQAHTDANGSFQLEGLAPGHYTLTANKTGLASGIVRDVDIAATNNVRITMKSGGTISGHVIGLSPKELEQTTVMAQSPNGGASSPVDATGNFRIEGAGTGTVRVTARTGQIFGGSSKSAPPKTVELEAGGSAQVDIEFKSDTVIRGRLTRNNQPLPNARVDFYPRQGKTQTFSNTTSDANGNYEIGGLEDGPYNVQVTDMERLAPFTATYDVHGSGTFDVDVRTASLRGRVLDAASGQPLSDVQIDVRPASSEGYFGTRGVVTDINGAFVVDNIARGSYHVSADKKDYGHDTKDVNVTETSEELEFKLNPSAGVTLKVVDGRDGRLLSANTRVTDLQGRDIPGDTPFRFGGGTAEPIKLSLAAGTYRVTVYAMGYAQRTLVVSSPSQQTVALTPGGTLLIQSKNNGRMHGRLIDDSGSTYLASPFNNLGLFNILNGTTTLNNIAAGHYRLDVLDDNNQVVKSLDVNVLEGQPAQYQV